jgi:acyl carrier protein
MNEQEILAKLTEVFRDVFDLPSLVLLPSTTAEDVEEWDSVNHIMLVVQTEREFGVKFQTAEIEEMKNVGDLVSLIKAKL